MSLERATRPKIVIDDRIPYIKRLAERIGTCVYLPGSAISRDDIREADALIVRTRTRCGASLLDGSRVRFVATATIGCDHLDTVYMERAGIGWANAPGCNAGSVAQYVHCSLLALGAKLAGKTAAIVGAGRVGSMVGNKLRAAGCRVLLCDPPRQEREGGAFVSLTEAAAAADIVCLHTPLTDEGPHATRHLLDKNFFDRLERRPVLISAGRGECVDTSALKTAIRAGRLGATVIDVWENEPCPDPELLAMADIATPHIAGYSADGKAAGTRMALEATARFFGLNETFRVEPPELPAGFCYFPAAHTSCEALRRYDPRRDSQLLKACPAAFETLRGDYPLRRE